MTATGAARVWQRMDRLERATCLRINRGCRGSAVHAVFVAASRLGDGIAWYALMASLALAGGAPGTTAAMQMAVAGGVGVLLYRVLKTRLVRERPFISHAAIRLGTAPLDRYSFPSGHTLHAVCFTILAVSHEPWLAPVLVPLALAIAASRVVLGLHYPSDVAAGALIGAALAAASLEFWPG